MRVPMLAIHPRPIAARPFALLADVRGPMPICAIAEDDRVDVELGPPAVRLELEEAIALAEALTSAELCALVRRYHEGRRVIAKARLSATEQARIEEQWAADNLSGRDWTRWRRGKRG